MQYFLWFLSYAYRMGYNRPPLKWGEKMPHWKIISVYARWGSVFRHVHLWWNAGVKSVSYPDFSLLLNRRKKIASHLYFFLFLQAETDRRSFNRMVLTQPKAQAYEKCLLASIERCEENWRYCRSLWMWTGWMGSGRASEREKESEMLDVMWGRRRSIPVRLVHPQNSASVSLYYTVSADGLVSTAPDDFGPTDQSLSVCRIDATMSLC